MGPDREVIRSKIDWGSAVLTGGWSPHLAPFPPVPPGIVRDRGDILAGSFGTPTGRARRARVGRSPFCSWTPFQFT